MLVNYADLASLNDLVCICITLLMLSITPTKAERNILCSDLRSRVLVGLSWASAMLFSLPMLIINETKIIDGSCQCWIEFPEPWFWKVSLKIILKRRF